MEGHRNRPISSIALRFHMARHNLNSPDGDLPPPPNPEAPLPPPEPPDLLNHLLDLLAGLHVRVSFCNSHHKPASSSTTIYSRLFLWSSRSFRRVPAIRSVADLVLADLSLLIYGISNTSAVKFLPPLYVKFGGVPEANPVRNFNFEHHGTRSGGSMQSMATGESKLFSGSDQVEKKTSGAFKSFGFENIFETLMGLAQFVLSADRVCEEGLGDLGLGVTCWVFSLF